ncbi:MAG: 4Fe-4S cluster-binding domain-containing protein [Pseudonocardiaceae bacterium]
MLTEYEPARSGRLGITKEAIKVIKEGLFTFIDGHAPVVPYKGKYAVKDPRVFDLIRAGWAEVGLGEAPYRPLRIECELTTKCNDTCRRCGMGARSLRKGMTLTDAQVATLVDQFGSISLPSVSITGGEPFVAMRTLLSFMKRVSSVADISKITTNGLWGSKNRCAPTFDLLAKNGLLENRLFVPLLMVSIGEQATPLEYVCRIVHYAATEFTDRELNIAVSSLADPADRKHKIYELMKLYERLYGTFPHDRVHSTMRVYLENDRLEDQAPIHRPGVTPVAKWMNHCYDCFAPTVGSYVLPTALMKQTGDLYACAAFNVPEKLRFGNLFAESALEILHRVNRSSYVVKIRAGGGLKAMHDVVPQSVTQSLTCSSYCGSCALLIEEFEQCTGERGVSGSVLPLIDATSLRSGNATATVPTMNAIGSRPVVTSRPQIAAALSEVLARATGRTPIFCTKPSLHLENDLGLDSLALLEVVTSLEAQLGLIVLDEDTGKVQTAGDLLEVLVRLAGAVPA